MLEMVQLSLVIMAMTLATFILYGIAANGVSRHMIGSPKLVRWLQRSIAAIFATLEIDWLWWIDRPVITISASDRCFADASHQQVRDFYEIQTK